MHRTALIASALVLLIASAGFVSLTDNDMMFTMRYALHSDRLTRFEQAVRSAGIEHRLLRPRSPESNGKVERLIQTGDEECFRVIQPQRSGARARALTLSLEYYNHARPHQSLGGTSSVDRRDAFFARRERNYCRGTPHPSTNLRTLLTRTTR